MWIAVAYLVAKVWWLERHPEIRGPSIAKAFYIGQAVKFLMLVIGLFVVTRLLQVDWMPFILGVMVVQVSSMTLSFQMKRKIIS